MAEATSVRACVRRHTLYPFDLWATEMSDMQKARLVALYRRLPAGSRVLDAGCNSGYAALLRPDCVWHGVDVSPRLVARAAAYMPACLAMAEALPYGDDAFDVAVLGEILEHVYDPAVVVAEAVRVARMMLIGSTPHEQSQWGKHSVARHPYHVRCFDEAALRSQLAPYGTPEITVAAGQFYVFEVALCR